MSELMSLEEASFRLGCSHRTVVRMVERGDLRQVRIGRLRRVRRDEIDAIVDGTTSPSTFEHEVVRARTDGGRFA